MNRRVWFAIMLPMACAALIGCGATTGTRQGTVPQPSRVQPIAGTNQNRVLLTPKAAAGLGIKTAAVRKAPVVKGAKSQHTVVPQAAVIYEADGSEWVYSALPATDADATEGWLTFERKPVIVAKIDGDDVELQSGPPEGTQVVTVGAAELLGTEDGVEGG